MTRTDWAGGKAYESPVAEAIELEPFDVILYGSGSTEDVDLDEDDGEW